MPSLKTTKKRMDEMKEKYENWLGPNFPKGTPPPKYTSSHAFSEVKKNLGAMPSTPRIEKFRIQPKPKYQPQYQIVEKQEPTRPTQREPLRQLKMRDQSTINRLAKLNTYEQKKAVLDVVRSDFHAPPNVEKEFTRKLQKNVKETRGQLYKDVPLQDQIQAAQNAKNKSQGAHDYAGKYNTSMQELLSKAFGRGLFGMFSNNNNS